MTSVKVSWAIPHLCGLPSVRRYSRLLVMLRSFRAFIDETGNDPNEPIFCFTGWIARVDEWESFSDAWSQELHRNPAIEYFKHHEAKARTEQFKDWPIAACERKILSLASVITRFEIKYGFTTGIRNDVVRNFMKLAVPSAKTARGLLHGVSRAYDWAFYSVVGLVLQRQVELGETDIVDFIFDEGDDAFNDCQRIYRDIVKQALPPAQRDIAGTVSTGNDRTLMPLQAADLLAGVSTVNLRGQRTGKAYRLLHKNKPLIFLPITKEQTPFPNIKNIISFMNVVWSTKMIEKAKRMEQKGEHLTPDEIGKIERDEEEKLDGWIKHLSPEEAQAWLDAHTDDLETSAEALLQEKADWEIIVRIVLPIARSHPQMSIKEAIDIVRKRENKTLAEAEALDAFERVKDKPLRAD